MTTNTAMNSPSLRPLNSTKSHGTEQLKILRPSLRQSHVHALEMRLLDASPETSYMALAPPSPSWQRSWQLPVSSWCRLEQTKLWLHNMSNMCCHNMSSIESFQDCTNQLRRTQHSMHNMSDENINGPGDCSDSQCTVEFLAQLRQLTPLILGRANVKTIPSRLHVVTHAHSCPSNSRRMLDGSMIHNFLAPPNIASFKSPTTTSLNHTDLSQS